MLKTSYLNGGKVITADAMNALVSAQTLTPGLRQTPGVTYNVGNTLTLTDFAGVISGATCKYTFQGELIDLSDALGIPVHVNSNSYQGSLVCAIDPDMYLESRIFVVSGLLTQEQAQASNYLVLAWFMYPGNNVALSSSQWFSYPVARQDHWLLSLTSRDFTWPSPLQVTKSIATVVTNTSDHDVTVTESFTVPVTTCQARSFRYLGVVPSGCYIRASVAGPGLVATGLRAIASDTANVVPVHGYQDLACTIPVQAITVNPWGYIVLTVAITVSAGSSLELNALGLTTEVSV